MTNACAQQALGPRRLAPFPTVAESPAGTLLPSVDSGLGPEPRRTHRVLGGVIGGGVVLGGLFGFAIGAYIGGQFSR